MGFKDFKKNILKNKYLHYFLYSLPVILTLLILFFLPIVIFKNRTVSNLYVNDLNLSFLTYEDFYKKLDNDFQNYWQSAIKIDLDSENYDAWLGVDLDNSNVVIDKNNKLTLNWRGVYCRLNKDYIDKNIYLYGKDFYKEWSVQNYIKLIKAIFSKDRFTYALICDETAVKQFLKNNLAVFENYPQNASYYFDTNGNLKIKEDQAGHVIDYDNLYQQIIDKINRKKTLNLKVKWLVKEADIRKVDLELKKKDFLDFLKLFYDVKIEKFDNGRDANAILRSYDYMRETNPENLQEFYDSEHDIYEFTVNDLRNWPKQDLEEDNKIYITLGSLSVKDFKNNIDVLKDENGNLYFQINREKLKEFLNKLNKLYKVEPVDAVLKLEEIADEKIDTDHVIDGDKLKNLDNKKYKVIEFTSPKLGVEIDIENSVDKIENLLKLNNPEKKEIVLARKILEPKAENLEDNPLQIKELIGLGVSDFSGSPWKRIHNIKTGAKKLNGLLIAPNEIFKTIPNLKPFNAAGGYLPELVIKGNETIPEYGGGLCQIGTTVFRAAIDAGLPVIERRPHRYNVSYYYPIGTDATIYDPHPDVRWLNDTGNYILIQTYVVSPKLYIEFWGVKDGRIVEKTKAINYNWVAPPAPKYIENSDLAPGKVIKKESAHYGVTGEFWERVIYPDGKVLFKKWISKYYPWQAVYEKGPDVNTNVDNSNVNTENTAENTTDTSTINTETNNNDSSANNN